MEELSANCVNDLCDPQTRRMVNGSQAWIWLALFNLKIYCFLPHIIIFLVKKEEVTW